MENVKACPFCGGEADITSNYSAKHKLYFFYIRCRNCGATGKPFKSETDPKLSDYNLPMCEEARLTWNDRP